MNTKPKTLASDWLKSATKDLNKSGDPTSRLDCLILLEDNLGETRAHILAHDDTHLTNQQFVKLNSQIELRKKHIPLAYIRGKSYFYGREFIVNNHTLVPRPESETMIDLAKQLTLLTKSSRVADIGCGSGCLGITLTLELPNIKIDLYDIDKVCIATSKENAEFLGAKAKYYLNDLLKDVDYSYDLILANLPYVPNTHTINKDAMNEPKHAIFGGPDGLSLYRRLFKQLHALNESPKYVLTESLPNQHQELKEIAKKLGYKLIKTDDFIQSFKSF
ncbi:MAG TPA: HemK/PrmC family methyltransferase [Candidatus Saccharimonadales bacterium]|nr:HemK/PrmC family methyltransferase [Candidatus Saccharimonadales bacterium]